MIMKIGKVTHEVTSPDRQIQIYRPGYRSGQRSEPEPIPVDWPVKKEAEVEEEAVAWRPWLGFDFDPVYLENIEPGKTYFGMDPGSPDDGVTAASYGFRMMPWNPYRFSVIDFGATT